MKIALTSLLVHDPQQAFEFYTQVLGFVEKLHVPEMNLAIVASPEEPNGTGLLLEPTTDELVKTYQQSLFTREIPALILSVVDIFEAYKNLTTKGVVFRKVPVKTDAGMQALFEDSCGNLIQLYQP